MSEQETPVPPKQPLKYRIDADDVTRSDVFRVAPDQIIRDVGMNGREKDHSQPAVDEMVESIINEGQLCPVVCRRVQGNKLKLVLGNRRWLAINKINSSPELLARAKVPEGQKLKIRVEVRDLNDLEAFRQNLTENMVRSELTPLDHAHNQRVLRERFNYTDQQIADFYKSSLNYEISLSYISLLKRTHQIPAELQQLIRDKKLSLSDGLDLTELPEQEQVQVVHEAQDANGKVDSSQVRGAVRKKKVSEGNSKSLTLKEVKDFFQKLKEENDTGSMNVFAVATLKFLNGAILEETYEKKLWDIFE